MAWALPNPEASFALATSDRLAPVTLPASTKSRINRAALKRQASPFIPKRSDKGKVNAGGASRLSDNELELQLARTEAALKRAGTSAAATVLSKRLDGLLLEHNTRRLRRTDLSGYAEEAETTPEQVRARLEETHLDDEVAPSVSLRSRRAASLQPSRNIKAKIAYIDWDEGERLLKEQWERDKQAREAQEALEEQRYRGMAPRLRESKHDALHHFMFAGAPDDEDDFSEAESDEGDEERVHESEFQ